MAMLHRSTSEVDSSSTRSSRQLSPIHASPQHSALGGSPVSKATVTSKQRESYMRSEECELDASKNASSTAQCFPDKSSLLHGVSKVLSCPSGKPVSLDVAAKKLCSASTQVLTSKLTLLQIEKESLQCELQQSYSTISTMEGQSSVLKQKSSRFEEKVVLLEEKITQLYDCQKDMKHTHITELSELQRTLKTEMKKEKQMLLNQIDELSQIKEEASKEIAQLRFSLTEAEAAAKSAFGECSEVESLKSELLVMQKRFDDTEQAKLSCQTTLEKQITQLQKDKDSLQCTCTKNAGEVVRMKKEIESMEGALRKFETENADLHKTMEQNLIASSIQQEKKYKDTIQSLGQELEEATATIQAQLKTIHALQCKDSSASRWNTDDSQLTGGDNTTQKAAKHKLRPQQDADTEVGKTVAKSASSQQYGRWTAHRADVRKQAEEMIFIVDSLAAEGYGPGKCSSDEVVRYLWKKREQMKAELHATRTALKKVLGEESFKLTQSLQQEKIQLLNQVQEIEKEVCRWKSKSEQSNDSLQRSIEEALEHHALKSGNVNAELQKKLQAVRREMTSIDLDLKNKDVDLSHAQREASDLKHELEMEKHTCDLLRSQVESMQKQLASQHKEVEDTACSCEQLKEKLRVSHKNNQACGVELTKVKSKAADEVGLLKLRVQCLTEERDSIQEEVFEIRKQLGSCEFELTKERTHSECLEERLKTVSEEMHWKSNELQSTLCKKNELQGELRNLRRELHQAHDNFTALEAEILTVQNACTILQSDLSQSSVLCAELEGSFLHANADLRESKEFVQKLQSSYYITQKQFEDAKNELKAKRRELTDLQLKFEPLTTELDKCVKQLEILDAKKNLMQQESQEKAKALERVQDELSSMQVKASDFESQSISLQNQLQEAHTCIKKQGKDLLELCESKAYLVESISEKSTELAHCKEELQALTNHKLKLEMENSALQHVKLEEENLKSQIEVQKVDLANSKRLVEGLEKEAALLKQESSSVCTELSNINRKLQESTKAKTELEKHLLVKESELEAQKNQLITKKKELDETKQQIISSDSTIKKLQSCATSEQEKCSTLETDLFKASSELQIMQTKFEHTERKLNELKDIREKEKLKREETEVELRGRLKDMQGSCMQLQSSFVEQKADLFSKESDIQSLSAELHELHTQLQEVKTDMRAESDKKESLEEQLKQSQKLEEIYKTQVQKLETDISFSKAESKTIQNELEKCQQSNDKEKAGNMKLQSEYDDCQCTVSSLQAEIKQKEKAITQQEHHLATLRRELREEVSRHQEVDRQLTDSKSQLSALCEKVSRVEEKSREKLNTSMAIHKDEKKLLISERDSLNKDLFQSKNKAATLKLQLQESESKLVTCCDELNLSKQRCSDLESALRSETRIQKELQSLLSESKSNHAQANEGIKQLAEQLAVESSTIRHVTAELKCSQAEQEGLKEELEQQRIAAASSLSELQRNTQKEIAMRQKQLKEVSKKCEKAQLEIQFLEESLSVANEQLKTNRCKHQESFYDLQSKLEDETSMLMLSEQKCKHLESEINERSKAKARVEEHLKEQTFLCNKHESIIYEQKRELMAVNKHLSVLQAEVQQQSDNLSKALSEKALLEGKFSKAKQQLEDSNITKSQYEAELSSLRSRKNALREKVLELQENIQILGTQYDERGHEILELSAANQTLTEEQLAASTNLSKLQLTLEERIHENKALEDRNELLEGQVARYEMKMTSLGKTQQKFQKQIESTSRANLQRVLGEVTEHMEQQYVAHKYLDKLRSENESMLFKEKEREISHLKSEVKRCRQDTKMTRLQVESLELEKKHMQVQKHDQDRSRRKLISRLEKVNETLHKSFPSAKFHSSERNSP